MTTQETLRINHCIIKLLKALEQNIEDVRGFKLHDAIKINKQITDSIVKLVGILPTLQRLEAQDDQQKYSPFPEEDAALIKEFLAKHQATGETI